MPDDLTTNAENTWCPGCGDFGIMGSFKNAVRLLEKDGIPRENVIITAGIGCFGKIFDYLKMSGVYGLHGRAHATAQGIKYANPDLKVVTFVGDGDGMGEGIAHLIFAAKRNADMTVIMHDNEVYALTTGQFTPLTEKGWKGPSTPEGSIEAPLNALTMMLEAGATFVAQGFSYNMPQLNGIIAEAIKHKGFSFINVLQPCTSYHDTTQLYKDNVDEIKEPYTTDKTEARRVCERKDKWPIGLIYKVDKETYHEELLKGHNPVKDSMSRAKRHAGIKNLLKPQL